MLSFKQILVSICFFSISHTSIAQDNIAIQLSKRCDVELKKYGVILPMPCDAKKDSTANKITFKKDYLVDGTLAGYVYITVTPNNYKTFDDIERVRNEMLDSYRKSAEELGLETKLGEVRKFRAQSSTHLHLRASDFPPVIGNSSFKYMYFNDLLIGNNYKVQYEILAPYNERVVHHLTELVRTIEWLPTHYKDSKTGLSMMIPGGDWKASPNSSGNGTLLIAHYVWEKMYANDRHRYPELLIQPMPSYSTSGFDKAISDIKNKLQQKGAKVSIDEEISLDNAIKAHHIAGDFNVNGEFYDQDNIWILQLSGNRFVELRSTLTCDKWGCQGDDSVVPLFMQLAESLKY